MNPCLIFVVQAEKVFSEVRRLEPHHLEGMEIYSTVLWHLQMETQLSGLAQELTELDKSSPEVRIELIILSSCSMSLRIILYKYMILCKDNCVWVQFGTGCSYKSHGYLNVCGQLICEK